jgi:hypothetical protein
MNKYRYVYFLKPYFSLYNYCEKYAHSAINLWYALESYNKNLQISVNHMYLKWWHEHQS